MNQLQKNINILLLLTTIILAVWYFNLRSQKIESLNSIAKMKDEIALQQEKGLTQQNLAREAQESAMMAQEIIESERDSINQLIRNCKNP